MMTPPRFKEHPTDADCCIMQFVNPSNGQVTRIVIKNVAFVEAILNAGKMEK